MPPDEELIALIDSMPAAFRARFEILEKIGTGGTGTVYKGWDKTLERAFALKVLNPDQATDERILRLHREAKTICQLKHPNIVDIYDFIVSDSGKPMMVMEFVDGESLEKIIEDEGPLSVEAGLDIMLQICEAMEYAHKRGVLHRDLTPSNILIRVNEHGYDEVKVVDFGIAKVEKDIKDRTIVKSGNLIGSATVISPEQARGHEIDSRSDVYSLGCSMFKTFTGSFPYRGDSLVEVVYRHTNDPIPMLEERAGKSFPPELNEIITKALQKTPGDRFQSMQEMKQAAEQAQANKESGAAEEVQIPVLRTSHYAFGIAAVIIIGLVSILSFTMSEKPKQSIVEELRVNVKNEQRWINLTDKEFTPALTELLKRHPDVRRIAWKSPSITSTQLTKLCEIPLEILDVRGTDINDKGLEVVSQCSSLRSLILIDCKQISDRGMAHVARLPNLICLSLTDTGIGDDGISELVKQNKKLVCLHMGNCLKISDRSIEQFQSLKQLDVLRLSGTSISRDGAVRILRAPGRLGYLGLHNMNLEDGDFPADNKIGISRIDLSGNGKLTNRIFDALSLWPNLFFLDINECPKIDREARKGFLRKFRSRGLIMTPGGLWDDESDDTEGYLEPTLYDRTKMKQSEIQHLLFDWGMDAKSSYLRESK